MKWAVRFETAMEAVETEISHANLAQESSEESESEKHLGRIQRDPRRVKPHRKHSQQNESEERERKANVTVNAARYEYESSSDSESLYLSAGRPHRRPVEHQTETSSEDEENERSGQEEFTGSGSDGRLEFEGTGSETESCE
jgi:hypothetical protein